MVGLIVVYIVENQTHTYMRMVKMAWYDPLNDRIIDAEPGTLTYYHEMGHQFLQRKFKYYYYREQIINNLLFVILMAIWVRHWITPLLIWLMVLIPFSDELFAWIWGYYQYTKDRQD